LKHGCDLYLSKSANRLEIKLSARPGAKRYPATAKDGVVKALGMQVAAAL